MSHLPRALFSDNPRPAAPKRPRRAEAGDTLIEVLIAIVVLGVTSVAILLAFSTSIVGSAEHRNLVTMDTALRSAAEEATSQFQLSANSATDSAFSCPSVNFAPNWQNLPPNYSASITSVQYWNASATPPAFTSPATPPLPTNATCIANAPQLIMITVTYNGTSANISTVVDDPLAPTPLVPNGPAELVFTTQPSNWTAGSTSGTQPVVAVEGANGAYFSDDASPISLSITPGTGPGGATLSSSCSGIESYGVVGFNGCSINMATTGSNLYTLTASDGTMTATSNPFSVAPGPAAQLAFSTEPSSSDGAGTAFSTQPAVTVEDAFGNTVTTDTSAVSLAITPQTGTPGATIACNTNPANVTGGIAAFSGCMVNTAGTGYTLTATDSSLASATSTAFSISAGAPAQLAFTTSPSNGTGGTAFGTQPVVTVEDAGGNVVSGNTSAVTLAITPNTGTSGATLSCTRNPVNALASTSSATFSGCNINSAGSGYTLTATDGSLASATSNAFSITSGPAAKLVFTTSPSNGTGGTAFGTQPVVTVEDAGGNTVTTGTASTSAVTVAITTGTGTSGATLSCTANPVNAVAGVATFSGCDINKIGTNYTLKATDGSLASATSNAFNVTVGPAYQVAITTSPITSSVNTAFGTQPVVTVEDAGGNTVTTGTASTSAVTVAITTGTGTSGAILSCTANPVNAVAGVATFSGCDINKIGTNYTLKATDGSLASATSNAFSITSGPAAKLVFTTSPSNGTGGTAFGTQPVVTVEDAGGNTVTTGTASTSAVTVAITTGTGTSGATLSCTANPVNAVAGVATFSGCDINKIGTNYTLKATDGSLASATSNAFNVTVGPAYQVAITTSPTGGTGGTAFTTQPVVTVQDAGGNTVTTGAASTSAVTLAILTNPSNGTLACTTNPVNAVAGVATFSGCNINTAGTGYSLVATDGVLASVASNTFNITVGSASQLVFTTSPGPSTTATAFGTQPGVTVEDAGGNVVTSPSYSISMAIATGTGTLSTCPNVTTVNGVASFSGCKITLGTQGSFTLKATSGSLTGTSSSFTVAGTATQLVFTTSPGASTSGTAFGIQPVVWVEDSSGDLVTSPSYAISMAIATGTGTLSTCPNVTTVNGVASFSGCKITLGTQGSFTLKATSGSLTGTSSSFTVAGNPSQLVFTVEPGGAVSGNAFTTQPVVWVEDSSGDLVTTSAAVINLAIGSGSTTGNLSSCVSNPVIASGGIASFSGCAITNNGSNTSYTLRASSSSPTFLTSGTSTSFSNP